MNSKFRILAILCFIILLASTKVFAYENNDNRVYNIETKISLDNVKSSNFIITHSIQRVFDSYGIKYLKENIDDVDGKKIILNNQNINVEYNYSDKNVFTDSRIMEIEDIPFSKILLKYTNILYDADKLKEYSNLDSYLQTDEEKQTIKTISNDIITGGQTPYQKAQAIYQYINTKYQYDESQNNGGFMDTIQSKRGVCEDFSELFMILARYNTIPTRLVVGLRVKPENVTNNYVEVSDRFHAWAEFYIQGFGWLMADPTTYTEKDINNVNRSVNWDSFVNDKNKDHIPLAYDVWENIVVKQFGEYKPMDIEIQYYIKNDNSIN